MRSAKVYEYKSIKALLAVSLVAALLSACAIHDATSDASGKTAANHENLPAGDSVAVSDSAGREVTVPAKPSRVVALTSSLSDIWVSAGGALTATSDDTFRERPELAESIPGLKSAGGLLEPNAEEIIAIDPQFALLSDSLPAHRELAGLLGKRDIPYYYAKSDTFADYLATLKDFTDITGRADLYTKLGVKQRKEIDALIAKVPLSERPRFLFMRVSTSKAEALSKDHIVCSIIDELGADNIAFTEEPVFKDLSIEAVIEADPDFIFAVMQGTDGEASEKVLSERFTSSPLWSGLRAVREGRFHILPKQLYQLKPNARWKDAYEGLFKILYPGAFG
jgi:iron complex transport system substrate-binding protein